MSGVTPAPITTKSQSISRPGLRDDLAHAILALEALELLAAVHLHAMLGERVLEEAAHLRAVDALERDVLEHHDLALLAERGERRRQLGADVAAADQRHPLGLGRLLAQRIGVADRAQVVDPVQMRARPRAGSARSNRSPAAPSRSATSSLLESFATRASRSSDMTLVRVSTSTRCSAYHSSGRNSTSSRDSSPRRYPFDSGGRLYGGSGSRPTSRMSPSAPCSRR